LITKDERRVSPPAVPVLVIRRAHYDEAKEIKVVANSHKYTKHFSHPGYCNRPNFFAGNILVAVVPADKIVGFVAMKTKRLETEIDIIAVLPEYRSSGIGAALLDYVIEHMKTPAIGLNVQCDNERAIQFYLRYGFSRRGKVVVANTEAYRMRKVCGKGVLL
jgi:ribosomal protein S18 acetylase RimI-like enzyme